MSRPRLGGSALRIRFPQHERTFLPASFPTQRGVRAAKQRNEALEGLVPCCAHKVTYSQRFLSTQCMVGRATCLPAGAMERRKYTHPLVVPRTSPDRFAAGSRERWDPNFPKGGLDPVGGSSPIARWPLVSGCYCGFEDRAGYREGSGEKAKRQGLSSTVGSRKKGSANSPSCCGLSCREAGRGPRTHAMIVLITMSLIFSQMASLLTPFWLR